MRDPQVTVRFSTKSWSSMTWMTWGYAYFRKHPYIYRYMNIYIHKYTAYNWLVINPMARLCPCMAIFSSTQVPSKKGVDPVV